MVIWNWFDDLITTDKDNSTEEPVMAEDNTPESNHVPIEIVEALSPEEEAFCGTG